MMKQQTVQSTATMSKESFAAFVSSKRRAEGLTQEELAKRLFVTNTTVSKWERGKSHS